jgi:mRNA-degrading endonuclease toxin of MazEF toxin-antitoxin module
LPAEIWWIDFGPGEPGEPAGTRPAVVVAPAAELGRLSPVVTVVPMTRSRRTYPFRLSVLPTPENGLLSPTFAQVDLVRTVSKERLVHLGGYVDSDTWNAIESLLFEYLDV